MKFTNEGQGIRYAFERMTDDERDVHLMNLQTMQLWQVPVLLEILTACLKISTYLGLLLKKTKAFEEEIAEIEDMEAI